MAAYLHPADAGGRAFLAPADVSAEVVYVSADYTFAYAIDAMPLVSKDFSFTYQVLNGEPMTLVRSTARTIKVGAASRAFTAPAPGYWDLTNPKKPKGLKDPNSALDFTFDWSEWLADIGGALISGITWTSGSMTIVAEPPADEGQFATVVLSAGNPGEQQLTCRITTDTVPPLTEDRTVTLIIEDR